MGIVVVSLVAPDNWSTVLQKTHPNSTDPSHIFTEWCSTTLEKSQPPKRCLCFDFSNGIPEELAAHFTDALNPAERALCPANRRYLPPFCRNFNWRQNYVLCAQLLSSSDSQIRNTFAALYTVSGMLGSWSGGRLPLGIGLAAFCRDSLLRWAKHCFAQSTNCSKRLPQNSQGPIVGNCEQ